MTAPGGVEVVVDHVSKSFEQGRITALVDASLKLDPGDFVSLIGPSGCGKSTLLNLIGALDRPDSGMITVGGRDLGQIKDLSDYRAATVGFVFQFPHLIPTLNSVENVQVPMMGRGLPRGQRERKALALLEDCAISHRAKAAPATMSGGERQRVGLARALMGEPQILLADEPTGNLDGAATEDLLRVLEAVRERHGVTIILCTHDPAVAAFADRIVRLANGRVDGERRLDRGGALEPRALGDP
ncbi:MAG: lipoprotein-releasing system ATP-binding protein LolD [Chloroflexota bacterium]